jgi:hypothetical protein
MDFEKSSSTMVDKKPNLGAIIEKIGSEVERLEKQADDMENRLCTLGGEFRGEVLKEDPGRKEPGNSVDRLAMLGLRLNRVNSRMSQMVSYLDNTL